MTLSLPVYKRTTEVTEEQIEKLSVAECLRLRNELRDELQRYYQANPGVLTRFLHRINERLVDAHYNDALEMEEAQEG